MKFVSEYNLFRRNASIFHQSALEKNYRIYNLRLLNLFAFSVKYCNIERTSIIQDAHFKKF